MCILSIVISMSYEPSFVGYQLVGDSQLLRFCEKLLNIPRRKSDGGLCISGQKIDELLQRVLEGNYPISEKLILMIGTNDLLQFSDFEKMRRGIESLVLELIKAAATELILLTVPPIPRIIHDRCRWCTLKEFNNHIKSLHNGVDIFVIDAYAKFMEESPQNIKATSFSRFVHINGIRRSFDCLKLFTIKETDKNGDDLPYWVQNCTYRCNHSLGYPIYSDFDQHTGDEAIRLNLFENYYDKYSSKTDLIHLNYDGLCEIQRLIVSQDYIKC